MKIIFFTALLLIVFSITAFADGDFQDLKFGMSHDEVINKLKDKYDLETLRMSDGYIWINGIEVGDKEFNATLSFDNNNNFYAFDLDSPRYSADHFKYDVINDCKYISTVFKNKYGKPVKSINPNYFSASSGISFTNIWNNKNYEIYTGITSYEFQYYATSHVASKKMETALRKYKKSSESKSAIKAVNDF